jgi:hypothetical protein
LRRFEHPQYQALLDRVKQDPTLEGSPEYTARKACAMCSLCGVGSRCIASFASRAWSVVERRPAAGGAAATAGAVEAAAAAAAAAGPSVVTYHAGREELGPAPFHSRWLDAGKAHCRGGQAGGSDRHLVPSDLLHAAQQRVRAAKPRAGTPGVRARRRELSGAHAALAALAALAASPHPARQRHA